MAEKKKESAVVKRELFPPLIPRPFFGLPGLRNAPYDIPDLPAPDLIGPFGSFEDDFEALIASGTISPILPWFESSETEKEVAITAKMEGIDADKIKVEVDGGFLVVSGKFEKKTEKDGRTEQENSEFRNSFSLDGINADGITAGMKDGILTLVLPKKPEPEKKEEARKIEIKVG
jgi:HSP20 family molecular chaperone IbpA